MEEILHWLIGSLSQYLQAFIHPRWCRMSAINSITLLNPNIKITLFPSFFWSLGSVCPFTVHRTASDNLPVYVIKRLNRTQDVTVVKKLRGDPDAFKREIEFLCQARASYGKSGFLQIVGNHKRVIKGYLRSIGYWKKWWRQKIWRLEKTQVGVDRDGVDLWFCKGGKTQDPQNDFHVWII